MPRRVRLPGASELFRGGHDAQEATPAGTASGRVRHDEKITVYVSADELIAHSREWIAGYKVPKSIEFRTEPLPLSGAMKVLKRELRAPYWEGHDRSVN